MTESFMELNKLTIKQAQKGLRKGDFSSFELTKACLKQIKAKNKELNVVLTVCEKEALSEAKKADIKIKRGEINELTGIPYLAKDNILTKGVKTTAASRILENYIAPFDATVIKKMREQGAILLGKTNMDEFAHGSSTENSAFGPTKNPHDITRVPGGSSGGSAVAVAADMCIFAMGTDTGGSIRHPASFCGVVGLKPTYGRASRFGLIAMTSSTDVPGPLTKTVEDAAIVLSVIAGHDKNDLTTTEVEIRNYEKEMKKKLSPSAEASEDKEEIKIGIPDEFFTPQRMSKTNSGAGFTKGMNKGVEKAVQDAVDDLKKQGAKVMKISLPYTKYALPVYYIITPSEISSNLGRYDGIRYGISIDKDVKDLLDVYKKTRGRGFGAETKRRIMLGTYALSAGYYDAYYLKAQKVRTKICEDFEEAFKKVDVIITPTSPDIAFKIGSRQDPVKMYLEDIFMVSPSLAGLPAISVPCGSVENLPVGVQLIGKKFDEGILFRVGNILTPPVI